MSDGNKIDDFVIARGDGGTDGAARGVLVKNMEQASKARSLGKGAILLKEDITLLAPWVWELDGIVATMGTDTTHFVLQGIEQRLPFVYGAAPALELEIAWQVGVEIIVDASHRLILHSWPRTKVAPSAGKREQRSIALPTFADKIADLKPQSWLQDWSVPMDARSVELVDLNNDGNHEVVVTTETAAVYAFSRDGKPIFQLKLPAKSTQVSTVYSPILGRYSLVLTCDSGHFFGVDPVAREVEWSIDELHAAKSICVASLAGKDHPKILLGGGDELRRGRVLEVDSSGKVIKRIDMPRPYPPQYGWVRAIDVCQRDDGTLLMVCGGYDGKVLCFQENDLIWTSEFGDRNWVRAIRFAKNRSGEWSILVGLKDGSLVFLDKNGRVRCRAQLEGWVNGLQVLPSTDPYTWHVLTFQLGGKVQLLNSNGKVVADLPSEPQLWGGLLEPSPEGGGDLWLCSQQRFAHHYLSPGLLATAWSEIRPVGPSEGYNYDVAISFAGEDRKIAEKLASSLAEWNVRVFYDAFFEEELWGKDLYVYLDEVFRQRARYCIVIISKHYADKMWCQHELRSAFARAFQENREYILPLRLDDTEIPGIRPTVAYISLSTTTNLK